MRSSTIVLAVGLFAAPLALLTTPDVSKGGGNIFAEARAQGSAPGGQPLNNRTFTDAPVSNLATPGVAPADRVAGEGGRTLDAGPVDGTPFSNLPAGYLADGGSQITERDRVYQPKEGQDTTPSLSR